MPRTTAPVVHLPRWRAPQPDGIAHAYPAHGNGRAVCGMQNQEERFDHPKGRRCPDCDRLLAAGAQA